MIFSLLGVDRILCDSNLIVSKTKALSLICNANIRESAFFVRAKFRVYDDAKIEELMQNSSIVRNRLKIKSAITNAQQFIKIQESYGSFDSFIWSYVDGKPILNHFQTETDIPARTALSDQISKDLKRLGFKFVGSTIIYAYMQAIGIVNDHVKGCHLYANK